ncbi:MAG TPA: glycosyltransferase [Candidatus Acidoferrales bacterium]|nr:glycosyltransferase [Candidatus Acidoferrales bacterium]
MSGHNVGVKSERLPSEGTTEFPGTPMPSGSTSKHMRILKIVQSYYPFQEKGGPVVKVRAIALGLAARGHSVTVLTADHGFQPSMVPNLHAEEGRWGWQMQEGGVDAIFLRTFGHYRAETFNPGLMRCAAQLIPNFDCVHIYGLYDFLGPAVAYECRGHRVPYLVEPMGMFRPIVRNLLLKKIYHAVFGRRLLQGAYRMIATAEQEKRELVAGGIDSARVVVRRNGIDVPERLPERGGFRRKWKIEPQTQIVLFLGRIVAKKSPDLLLDAFARMLREAPDAKNSVLVFAGPTEEASYITNLRSRAAALGISESVLFTGPIYDEAKWAAYRDADVFALPSQNENFGNSAAEAMACGTPVIVSNQCGIAPLIEGKTGLVVPHDTRAVADALKALLQDNRLAQEFRDACPSAIRGLSWDEPLTQMEELYREAASQSKPA